MMKHFIAIVLLSILITLTMPQIQQSLQALATGYHWISQQLMEVFAGGSTGSLIRNLLALLAIPLLIGLIPAVAYWLAKRKWFPYFMEMVWVVWLVQVAVIVILYKAAV